MDLLEIRIGHLDRKLNAQYGVEVGDISQKQRRSGLSGSGLVKKLCRYINITRKESLTLTYSAYEGCPGTYTSISTPIKSKSPNTD